MAMLRHVVLIRFKPETAPDRIRAIESAFAALQAKIAGIEALEWGTNCSPEGKDQGFTHCFLLTFASAAARDAYLPHPEHQSFSALLRPYVDQVLVIDYVPNN
jgi:Stress responsive A/B Barrel Domain